MTAPKVHKLEGCSPTPLANYLKALAVLRLVSEQRDPEARGFWKDEAFWLVTRLSRDELVAFFLDDYMPTPILSPWNGGSGFYFREEKSKEKDPSTGKLKKTGVRNEPTAATRAVDALLASTAPRLAKYAGCAKIAKSLLAELGLDAAPDDATEKAALIAAIRSRLLSSGLDWVDASVTSMGDEFSCAPMAGSGGNDGNEDFSKNFLVRVLELISPGTEDSRSLLGQCLFGGAVPGAHDSAAGQFSPGGNAGVNAGAGFKGDAVANSWDYVLAIEGSILFGGAASRRLDASSAGGAFPFAVRIDPVGYGSAADADRDASRAEIWLPLWTQPTSLRELSALLSEGRARIDRAEAQRTTDVARAIAGLGTSRGVAAFERTAFFTRNGNMHYSVPVGRWPVSAQPHEELLDDIETWVARLRRFSRDKLAPKAVTAAARAVDEAILAVCRGGEDPMRWQALLVALGRAECALLGSPQKAGDPLRQLAPLPPLRPAWISAANDGSPELRLAVALASQDVALRTQNGAGWLNVRAHWMPLDRSRAPRLTHAARGPARFATDGGGLANDPDVVCGGHDLERDCIDLVRRRVQLAPGLATRGLGLSGACGAEAPLGDVTAFLAGLVDDRRLLALGRPLMAIAWWQRDLPRLDAPTSVSIDAAYAVARLVHLSKPLERREPLTIPLDPEPIARLAAGDLAGALAIALRRLRASGLRPRVRHLVGNERDARRLAASLAFPVRASDVCRCADFVTKPQDLEETNHVD
ncbi:MAG: type I-U CRISPR-associated protein Csx17 [Deltaproteobacteria bacterium]|nr:type I-U CRISPR-associated protein Csx17 [Deltaproteobacteria bacterium]